MEVLKGLLGNRIITMHLKTFWWKCQPGLLYLYSLQSSFIIIENKLDHDLQYVDKNTWFIWNPFIHSSKETIVYASPCVQCGRLNVESDPETVPAKGSK